jgi:hypothetical protein
VPACVAHQQCSDPVANNVPNSAQQPTIRQRTVPKRVLLMFAMHSTLTASQFNGVLASTQCSALHRFSSQQQREQIVCFRTESARTTDIGGANADDVISSASVTCSHCATVSPVDPPCCVCLVSATTGQASLAIPRQRCLFGGVRHVRAEVGWRSRAEQRPALNVNEPVRSKQCGRFGQHRKPSANTTEQTRTAPNSD